MIATSEANRKRGAANAEHNRRNHEWAREHDSDGRDGAWFLREAVPKLSAYPLSAIAAATGLSLAACSRIRAGSQVPHPRHWDDLLAIFESDRLSTIDKATMKEQSGSTGASHDA